MVVLYYYWLTAYNLPVPYGICECVCVSTFVYVCVCVQTHRRISFEVTGVEVLLTFYQLGEA